jgi:hypothetical protein
VFAKVYIVVELLVEQVNFWSVAVLVVKVLHIHRDLMMDVLVALEHAEIVMVLGYS